MFDGPHGLRDRPPECEQDQKRDAGEQHIDASFHRLRHDSGPAALEALSRHDRMLKAQEADQPQIDDEGSDPVARRPADHRRTEEHTSEIQSLMRTSYAVLSLKKKTTTSTKSHS